MGSLPHALQKRDALAVNGTHTNLLLPLAFRVQSLSKFDTGTNPNLTLASPVWSDCSGPPKNETDILEFRCPTLYTTQPEFRESFVYAVPISFTFVTVNQSHGVPEVLVMANFTLLPNFFKGGYWQAVRISVGFGDSLAADILANSEPIPLLPNMHLSAGISTVFTQTYSNKNLAALGLNRVSNRVSVQLCNH